MVAKNHRIFEHVNIFVHLNELLKNTVAVCCLGPRRSSAACDERAASRKSCAALLKVCRFEVDLERALCVRRPKIGAAQT